MAQLTSYKIIDPESHQPIERARLAGRGWAIEVSVLAGGAGLHIYATGNMAGAMELRVAPVSRNIIEVSSEAAMS
jgi:hypothetical protein